MSGPFGANDLGKTAAIGACRAARLGYNTQGTILPRNLYTRVVSNGVDHLKNREGNGNAAASCIQDPSSAGSNRLFERRRPDLVRCVRTHIERQIGESALPGKAAVAPAHALATPLGSDANE